MPPASIRVARLGQIFRFSAGPNTSTDNIERLADMAPPLGIIITVSILVAATLAAYENPNVRAWIDRTRQKVAMGVYSLGDEIHPRQSRAMRSSTDASMMEEKSDAAEARRQRVRAEIMERTRVLREGRKRPKPLGSTTPTSPSFDTLVDDQGKLRQASDARQGGMVASTSAVEATGHVGTLRARHQIPIEADLHQSVDANIPLRRLPQRPESATHLTDPFESWYELGMRNTWNLPLPDRASMPSSHASDSLVDLTPTTEDFPDPDYSIPSADALPGHPAQSDYFSAAASRRSSQTMSEAEPDFYYAHPSNPMVPLEPRRQRAQSEIAFSVSSAPSAAGSTHHIHASEAEMSEDDLSSEPDGIRTPASAWTEVGSTVSADA